MLKKLSGSIFGAAFCLAAIAQDSTKSLTFSGFVDGYYRYNNGKGSTNNKTSFTNSANSFELGTASLRADASALSGKVTATVDLGFGSRAQEFSYNDGAALSAIKQAYITYAPASAIKFTAGKFATHVGYELLDAPLNRNYSMSYMFTNGPFFHTGIKADITLGKIGFMIGIADPVDRTTSSSGVKTLLAQISSTSSDKFKLYLNYFGYFGNTKESLDVAFDGAQAVNQFDVVATGVVSDKFNIGFNGTVQSRKKVYTQGKDATAKSWYGAALYLNVDPSPSAGLTLRTEYLSDKDAFFYGTKNIFESTLSFNYKVGPFTLIPELRLDTAKDGLFVSSDGTASKSTFSAIFAAIYKF